VENIYSRPELLEASRAFRQEQLEGFLGIEPTICGVEVLPLTPRMAMELELSGNAFFDYGDVRAVDMLQFIHRISARHWMPGPMRIRKGWRMLKLRRFLFDKPAEEISSGIKDYLRRTHAARPMFKKSGQPDFVPSDSCWLSYVVDSLCGWYPHLTFEAALDTPYRIIWQLWNRQLEKLDPDYVQRAPGVMEGRAKYLAELNAKMKADFEASKKKDANGKRS